MGKHDINDSLERPGLNKDVKVVVAGPAKSGKTALVQRFVNNTFSSVSSFYTSPSFLTKNKNPFPSHKRRFGLIRSKNELFTNRGMRNAKQVSSICYGSLFTLVELFEFANINHFPLEFFSTPNCYFFSHFAAVHCHLCKSERVYILLI